MVNTVATLLIPKYCIFIFTPRHVISHVISSSIGDVPDKNFATPFFFFFLHDLHEKNAFKKPNPPSLAFGCAVSSSWNVLPEYLPLHQPNLSQSSELLSILQKPSSNTSFPSLLRKNLLFSPVSYHRIIIYVACLFL